MIFDAFCKVQLIFIDIFLLEQKYQINSQLPVGAAALCIVVMEPLPTDHTAGRSWYKVAGDQDELEAARVLDGFCTYVYQLGD